MKPLLISLMWLLACGPTSSSAGESPAPPQERRAPGGSEPAREVEQPSTREVEPPPGAGWSFDEGMPDGFVVSVGDWTVQDGQLAQNEPSGHSAFNLILASGTRMADLDITVRLHAVSGQIDQGGGLVWRAQDPTNYYVARFNPLEDNFRVYTVVDGHRSQLASAVIEAHQEWDSMRVVMVGDHIQCYLNGTLHLDVHDSTFAAPGAVGLWTKADARTLFDDFGVQDAVDE